LEEIRRTDLTAAARAVRVRTLIIAGACDPLFGQAHQEALAEALAGSRLVWAQDCGHNPHWEDPAFVAKAIADVLPAE
ncbi:alpha/beta hydrolase, partial [Mesorhizobium sp.]